MTNSGWNTKDRYENIVHPKDIEKNNYCKENNIPLLRIPYYDYEKLNENYLEREIKKCIERMLQK